MDVVKGFLLQIALIAMPIFGYQMPWEKHKKKIIMTVLWGIAIVTCMSFPVNYDMQYRLDIRIIPLLLGFMYGGLRTGVCLMVILIAYRFYLGLDIGFYTTILTIVLGIPPVILLRKAFRNGDLSRKLLLACLLSCLYCLIGMAGSSYLRGFTVSGLIVQSIHLGFVLVMTWIFIRLNEFIYEVQFMRIEAERLRTISELTSLFAHEIRNPMQTTRGFLQLLDEPGLSEKKKQYIKLSIDELDRANGIISDYLAFGKPASDQLQPVDIAHELSRAANVLHPYTANQGVNINIHPQYACWVNVNPQQVSQLLINLLKNAIESMPDGGTIDMACMSEGDLIAIHIKDQGVGMSQEQLDKLGSPFYSLKETGTGLGMIVCYQIVRQFGGKINVTSELGSGTEVSIHLPRLQWPEAGEPE